MKILIAYGTTEGHTHKVSEFISERARELGHAADLMDLSRKRGNADPNSYDRVIVAGSVHQKRHQEAVGGFIVANRAALAEKPTLFISVSLSAAFEEGGAEAQQYINDFLTNLDWSPSAALPIAGALKYDEYDFFKSQIIEHVVLDGRYESGKADREFTDWPALTEAIDQFIAA